MSRLVCYLLIEQVAIGRNTYHSVIICVFVCVFVLICVFVCFFVFGFWLVRSCLFIILIKSLLAPCVLIEQVTIGQNTYRWNTITQAIVFGDVEINEYEPLTSCKCF